MFLLHSFHPGPQYQNWVYAKLAEIVKIIKISTIPMIYKNLEEAFFNHNIRTAITININECLPCAKYCLKHCTCINSVLTRALQSPPRSGFCWTSLLFCSMLFLPRAGARLVSEGTRGNLNKVQIHQYDADWWNQKLWNMSQEATF